MKAFILTLFLLFLSCGNEAVERGQLYNYNKSSMKNIYYLNYDLSGDFEVIINGISLAKNKKEGVMMNYEYLNPFISKSGKQSITLSLKALGREVKLSAKTLNEISLEIFLSENTVDPPFKKIQTLKLPLYKEAQKEVIFTWTFEAEVPFEITTLADAKDLTQEDPSKLLEEVVEKNRTIHSIINAGNINDYLKLYNESLNRELITMYNDDESKRSAYVQQVKAFIAAGKNCMLPLQNFLLHIHPNGKIVELADAEGNAVLISEDDKDIQTYGLQLYRSIKTGKLEVY